MFNGTITVTEAGRSDTAKCDMVCEAKEEEKILAVVSGKVTKSRLRIVKEENSITARKGLQKDSRIDRSPLTGETIEFEKIGVGWKKSLVGKTPTAQQAEELNRFPPPVRDAEVYPDQPVKPCHKWNLDVKKIYGFMPHSFDLESGICTREFEKMIDWKGMYCAHVAQNLELHGRMRAKKDQWLHCDLKVSGPIQRFISQGFTAGCQMKGMITLSGKLSEGGKEIQTAIAGPITMEWQTERK
jgi:hypothetical protein